MSGFGLAARRSHHPQPKLEALADGAANVKRNDDSDGLIPCHGGETVVDLDPADAAHYQLSDMMRIGNKKPSR
jgi:hypothetical protein